MVFFRGDSLTRAATISQSSSRKPDFVILLHQNLDPTAIKASTHVAIEEAYSGGCLVAWMSRPGGGGGGADMTTKGRGRRTGEYALR